MTQSPKPLNKLEVWVAEHSAPIFGALAVLIIIGAGLVFYTFEKSGDTQDQVNVLRPEVTTINRAICDTRSLESEKKARRCAERIRVGLVNCKRVQRCRAAFLAVLTYPPPARRATSAPSIDDVEGGGAQQPKGNQQPGPGSQPGQEGDHDNGRDEGHSPGAEAAPGAPQGGSEGDTPADTGGGQGGGDNGSRGGSSSGAGVEVCVPGVTCIEAEVGLPDLKPKGLLP